MESDEHHDEAKIRDYMTEYFFPATMTKIWNLRRFRAMFPAKLRNSEDILKLYGEYVEERKRTISKIHTNISQFMIPIQETQKSSVFKLREQSLQGAIRELRKRKEKLEQCIQTEQREIFDYEEKIDRSISSMKMKRLRPSAGVKTDQLNSIVELAEMLLPAPTEPESEHQKDKPSLPVDES
eukprot:TRINITY_DN5834_c0_g1_i1.p1 TRINITY_DN5834_c0_g1~~TRINITY_DN5834_c0_g1_i1.p1  ORF type:complete len:182 (-),score=44.08 TRINITY_DN5834_c0_g1_i1:79-624(-)